MNRRIIILFAVPLVGGLLVLGAVALRDGASAESAPPRRNPSVSAQVEGAIRPAPPPRPIPKPAPEKAIARAMDEARLKTTYQNYRTALATGNHTQADALYPILRRERKAALRLAEEDLSQARENFDRAVAGKAVDALRR